MNGPLDVNNQTDAKFGHLMRKPKSVKENIVKVKKWEKAQFGIVLICENNLFNNVLGFDIIKEGLTSGPKFCCK